MAMLRRQCFERCSLSGSPRAGSFYLSVYLYQNQNIACRRGNGAASGDLAPEDGVGGGTGDDDNDQQWP